MSSGFRFFTKNSIFYKKTGPARSSWSNPWDSALGTNKNVFSEHVENISKKKYH